VHGCAWSGCRVGWGQLTPANPNPNPSRSRGCRRPWRSRRPPRGRAWVSQRTGRAASPAGLGSARLVRIGVRARARARVSPRVRVRVRASPRVRVRVRVRVTLA
jgi:hypothetical protein